MADNGCPPGRGSHPGPHLGRPHHPIGAGPPTHATVPKPASNAIIAAGLISGPRIVILHRYNGDFGFTLRHFIVYPPESLTEHAINPLTAAGVLNFAQPMDTVFVKKVHPNTPAYLAGLQEGDRLLAVNGVPVTSIPYSQVVATIQQTPKTLTLQVVPKNYDILQTFFSETAHNPETNQRPQPQQPVVYAPKPASSATGAYPKSKPAHGPPPQPQPATAIVQHQQHQPLSVEGVQEKQESLYSTLQEIVADNVAVTGGAPAKAAQLLPLHADVPKMLSHGPGMVPMAAHHLPVSLQKAGVPPVGAKPYEYDPLKHQQQYMHQQHQQFLQKIALPGGKEGELGEAAGYGAPLADGDNAIMNRMRKSLEQKEEFLRRPPTTGAALQATPAAGHDVQQREFYARPNRLQKSVWPPTQPLSPGFSGAGGDKAPAPSTPSTSTHASPTAAGVSPPGPKPPTNAGGGSTTNGVMREHASQLSAIREHFFTGGVGGSLQLPPKSAPPSLAIAPAAITVPAGPSSPTGAATVPLSPHSLHAVSEKAKLFESGRPLSPEGIDRMDLYKSELSRINTKQVVPNVAVRRKEFELKAESTGWRKSIDDKPRSVSSDSESRRTPVRLRSLSVESNATRDSRHSLASSTLQATDAAFDTLEKDKENQHQPQQQQQQQQPSAVPPPMPMLRQKPIRDDSYRSAVRNSTDAALPTVVMRQKQPHHSLLLDDEDRKMRRVSYLRATAHDNLFQMLESDPDSSPMSLPPADTPDTDPTEPASSTVELSSGLATTDEGAPASGKLQPQQLKSHGTKSKALAHFRDGGAADSTEPVVREGELHVKVTLIDGKRSADRSWRTVHAVLRGHHLKLTLVREGKNSNQSPEPCGTIDLTNFHVTEGNYTKRKNVFKLTTAAGSYCPLEAAAAAGFGGHAEVHRTQSASGLATVGGSGPGSSTCASSVRSASTAGLPGSERELLLQADSHGDMEGWMESLRLVCGSTGQLHSPDYLSGRGGQQAEPQRIAAQTSVQVQGGSVGGSNSGDDYSPVLPAKSQRKYALGSRSPSGQSPVTKSRKTPQAGCSSPTDSADQSIASTSNQPAYHQPPHHYQQQQQQQHHHHHHHGAKDSSDRESGSPKSKTWKGIMAAKFRKMQWQPAAADLPDNAPTGLPLELCPVSSRNRFLPLVVEKCISVVESKGLLVVGIYRIPGNTAAIAALTETINRGLDEVALNDPRWDDVNVVSSLLKAFFRNLPQPVLPDAMYRGFISADQQSGQRRLIALRQMLERIPRMNYETLKYLMRHLVLVTAHSEANLMDPRNLAIVFGPSVVRCTSDSIQSAVMDMRHQCQIIEVLIIYYAYFFEEGLLPSAEEAQSAAGSEADAGPGASLLLENAGRIEPLRDPPKESSSGFVANIVQAANRKIRRTAQRKSTMSSTTPDTLSLDSTTSAESREQSSRVIQRVYQEQGPRPGTSHGGPAAGPGGSQQALQTVPDAGGPMAVPVPRGTRSVGSAEPGCEPPTEDSLMQLHHHHHHHHHYYHSSRHHSSQSNDDASSVLNRSSEDDSNDSAFADNGSMSLKTVTIALDNKLRSLRDSSVDSDRDQALESESGGSEQPGYGSGRHHSLHQQWSHMGGRSPRPLTLGENIPYADESPERPLIQGRSKPARTLPAPGAVNNNNNNNHEDGGAVVPLAATPAKQQQLKKALTAHSQKSIDSGGTINSSTTNSCLTLVNEADATLDAGAGVGAGVDGHEEDDDGQQQQPVPAVVGKAGQRNASLSSDETDTSTTSNPREKLTAATYRIDTEKLKKMNRILTQLERKANNLERKFNLNRSLSLNYKSPKAADCCCTHHGLPAISHSSQAPLPHCCQHQQQQQQQQQQHISNNLNNNNSTSCHNHNAGTTIGSLRSRFSLTKDEKTDKNINRRRQIHDTCAVHPSGPTPAGNDSSSCGEQQPCGGGGGGGPQIILTPAAPPPAASSGGGRQRRHVGSRSIRRRHTVGGTHDYYANKLNAQHHHHHHHHHPHREHIAGPGCCPVPQN